MAVRKIDIGTVCVGDRAQREHYRFLYTYGDMTVCAEANWYNAPVPFTASFRLCFERAVVLYEQSRLVAFEEGSLEGQFLRV